MEPVCAACLATDVTGQTTALMTCNGAVGSDALRAAVITRSTAARVRTPRTAVCAITSMRTCYIDRR